MNTNVDFQKSIEDAFCIYAASVAQERSIPDVRDFLKIGLRQGLYAQFTNGLTHKNKYQKAQKSVAAAMSQSYVHGDAAMYDTFIRAAKPWSYRYLVEETASGHGTQASPDDHPASRYAEMRSSELSDVFFKGLKKNAVSEWYDNYDNTELIPSVLPSIGYWNIVNGCLGIAVAMSTSVPQFNLKEVNNALIKIIKNPNVSFDEIYCAPDFATGGTLINSVAVKEALKVGKGSSCKLQAKIEYNEKLHMLQVTEIPYGVFTNTVIEQIGALINDDPDYGIDKVIDYTKEFADIRIYLNKKASPAVVTKKLYKDTSLSSWIGINMTLLDNGRFPKTFGWREACDAYIEHIRICERNILQYDYDKALARLNVVEGLLTAAANIDEVVQIIRSSDSPANAAEKLIARFGFNKEQVEAILAMKLSSLTKVDAIKLNNEKQELLSTIGNLAKTLQTPSMIDDILIQNLQEVAIKFGDDRRTKIENILIDTKEKEEEKEIALNFYADGTIETSVEEIKSKQSPLYSYHTTTSEKGLVFMNSGIVYPFALKGRMDGMSIYDLTRCASADKPVFFIDTATLGLYQNILVVTKKGYVKKMSASEITRNKASYEKLEKDDEVVKILLSNSENDKILVISSKARYTYYGVSNISFSSRNSRGQIGIRLDPDDYVVDAAINEDAIRNTYVVTLSKSRKIKRADVNEYPTTAAYSKGYEAAKLMDNDTLDKVYFITDDLKNIVFVSKNKVKIAPISTIPISGRATIGIKVITI